jgi:hypothetical protein
MCKAERGTQMIDDEVNPTEGRFDLADVGLRARSVRGDEGGERSQEPGSGPNRENAHLHSGHVR